MDQNNTQLRYHGFFSTPKLWNTNSLNGLTQLDFPEIQQSRIEKTINEIRLGKLIEHFVFNEFEQIPALTILASNIQLINNKITIGEIDCLIKYLSRYIHVEIIYKFYLYDPKIKSSEIDKWIGPNRNDTLAKKIDKLKTKQLPILKHQKAKEFLNKHGLGSNVFDQKVYFKAQLFVPFNMLNKKMDLINSQCIKGYYLKFNEIKKLNANLFYIPSKLDWLIEPNNNVNWEEKPVFLVKISKYMKAEKSPLCWSKDNKGNLCKIFVVFWF
jgi:uncharacterized protein